MAEASMANSLTLSVSQLTTRHQQKDARVCAQLFCFDSASGYCVSYRPAAEGSPCGEAQVSPWLVNLPSFQIKSDCVAVHE